MVRDESCGNDTERYLMSHKGRDSQGVSDWRWNVQCLSLSSLSLRRSPHYARNVCFTEKHKPVSLLEFRFTLDKINNKLSMF